MRERPILFGSQMVRAILEGRKTQTRRIVKPQHDWYVDNGDNGTNRVYLQDYVTGEPEPVEVHCPYGEVGDRLWIKTGYGTRYDKRIDTTYWSIDSGFVSTNGKPLSKNGNQKRDRKHPGMFMPFWLSQQLGLPTLEITGVRVERLQDISEADAMAEGIPSLIDPLFAVDEFQRLWESINSHESWSANPWVWVIEFKREEP